MLIDRLLNDSQNYIHLMSLLRFDHTILVNSRNDLLIYFHESNIYIAESTTKCPTSFISVIKSYNPDRLETTNPTIYNLMKDSFITSYACIQYGPFEKKQCNPHLLPLFTENLDYVLKTYHNEDYIHQLFDRNRILGYYSNHNLIGYIAKHIDGSIGALYVTPQYRNQGYGMEILKGATYYFDDPLIYSQVMDDNIISIKLHNNLNIHQSTPKIYWMYNKEFSF